MRRSSAGIKPVKVVRWANNVIENKSYVNMMDIDHKLKEGATEAMSTREVMSPGRKGPTIDWSASLDLTKVAPSDEDSSDGDEFKTGNDLQCSAQGFVASTGAVATSSEIPTSKSDHTTTQPMPESLSSPQGNNEKTYASLPPLSAATISNFSFAVQEYKEKVDLLTHVIAGKLRDIDDIASHLKNLEQCMDKTSGEVHGRLIEFTVGLELFTKHQLDTCTKGLHGWSEDVPTKLKQLLADVDPAV